MELMEKQGARAGVADEHPLIALALDAPVTSAEAHSPVVWCGSDETNWNGFYPREPEEGLRIVGMLWFAEVKEQVEKELNTLWLVDPDGPEAA